ncbi:hypothetical protein [Agromyces italicus]|uniref:hypothetical protein n=1 Tax=Agromyces italicus TaxID=279572 RepID=UPI0003B5DF24|nr:hypothetical protein [Agromyces italicus]
MNDDPARAMLDDLEYADLHDEATVVVSRTDDETVVVDRTVVRADAAADATVVVPRSSGPDEATVVVDRADASKPRLTHQGASVMRAPTRRDRRRPAPAPVSEEVLRTAEPGAGPGVLDRYEARAPEASPLPSPPRFAAGPPPTRDTTEALPSVARRSRRTAIVSIGVFAGACLISVGGLVALVVTALGELFG